MEQQVIKLYQSGMGIPSISKQFNTYSSRIRNILIKHGIKLRSRSESQALVLKQGRSEHPTKGRKHSEKTKELIGQKTFKNWEEMSDEKRQAISQKHKDSWDKMTPKQREDFSRKGFEQIRKASKEGSKLEKFVVDVLEEAGYKVIFHKQNYLASSDLEVDILLPVENIAIEIDGVSHFDPVWGEETLQRNISADNRKNGLLMAKGYKVVRVKDSIKSYSKTRFNMVKEKVLETIEKVVQSDNKFIEIEVS